MVIQKKFSKFLIYFLEFSLKIKKHSTSVGNASFKALTESDSDNSKGKFNTLPLPRQSSTISDGSDDDGGIRG